MPEWSVWPSNSTVPVKVPVLSSVGDFAQDIIMSDKINAIVIILVLIDIYQG